MPNLRLIAARSELARLNTYDDVREKAMRRLPRMIFDFVDGGAEGEVTLRANRESLEQVTFEPRFLSDVSDRSIHTTVLGQQVSTPFLLAPAGLATVVHPEGELAVARAAAAAGTVFCLSTASGFPMEAVAEASNGGALWFQLYLWSREEVVLSLLDRAKACGFSVLVLTIDVPAVGKRERDLRNGMSLPPRIRPRTALDAIRHPRWLARTLTGTEVTFGNLLGVAEGDSAASIGAYVERELVDRRATWDRLRWLRGVWDGPIAVKGVVGVGDAERAVACGADAVYVSNHGGRQLDSVAGTTAALPRIVDAVGDRVEVLLDGGVRRGSDVVKARALGARGVLGGRLWFHALAADGERGVRRMLEINAEEIDRTLALLGVPQIDAVDRSCLRSEDTDA